jgi:transcriptional regulator of acetoin/glycerol metabolism
MGYMIAKTGDCSFCKAIIITRGRATHPRCRATRSRAPTRTGRRTPLPTRSPLHLLERTQRNVSKAARLAGIDRNYLYRMTKKHGIARKE